MTALLTTKAKGAFGDYRMAASLPIFRIFAVFVSAFNLLLLIPDLMNISDQSVWMLIAVRTVYSAVVLSSLFWIIRFESFLARSIVTSVLEVMAVIIFLFVFRLYPQADFLIQMMGVMAIILVTFIVPNVWLFSVGISFLAAAGFLLLAKMGIGDLAPGHFYAGMVYLAFEIVVGAIYSLSFLRYQYREFVAKTELERIYSTDPLTKIGNRVKLEEEANKWLTFCEKDNQPLCLVLLDVDNLKQINDDHGHLVGDTVLYETAQILRSKLRKKDVCVRWGGDEFILLLPCMSVDQAHKLATEIKDTITSYEFSARIEISCSFGITQMQRGQSLEQLIAQADASMYLAKAHGKNTIEVGVGISY